MIGAMATRARLALYRSLRRARTRREEGLYVVEGHRLVEEALLSGAPLETVLVTAAYRETAEGAALADRAASCGLEVEVLSAKEVDRIADTKTPQGVLAVVREVPADPAVLAAEGLFLALDAVSDPGNAGTLVRTADAFAVRAVLFGPGSADFLNPKTLRAAMGSTFHLPLLRIEDLPLRLREMRRAGARVLAATLDGEDLYAVKTRAARTVLVLGSEAHGVSREVRDAADLEVTVPCPGRAESLNVAMAGAVALAHLAREDTA